MAIVDLVKFEGLPNDLAWKFPNDELSTWTQLIVNESYEAILYKEGQALDLFPAGKYTLESKNIPVLSNSSLKNQVIPLKNLLQIRHFL